MTEPVEKRVDESWKEQAEREKQVPGSPTPEPSRSREEPEGPVQARFELFISGIAMEALIALGDVPHPVTRKQAANLGQAKYAIDLLGIIEEKTKGNLTVDEQRLLTDTLYQLRMRYLTKAGG